MIAAPTSLGTTRASRVGFDAPVETVSSARARPPAREARALPEQTDLFDPEIVQKFEAWKATPGGGKVLRIIYAITAGYARRFHKTGRRVSMKLIWEQVRDHLCYLRTRLQPVDGYTLNNNFHSLVARHIVRHRPQWDGLFELRERHPRSE